MENSTTYDIQKIRRCLESIFDTKNAEDVAHDVLTLLHLERTLASLSISSRKRVLFALCKQYGVLINEKELFNIKNE